MAEKRYVVTTGDTIQLHAKNGTLQLEVGEFVKAGRWSPFRRRLQCVELKLSGAGVQN